MAGTAGDDKIVLMVDMDTKESVDKVYSYEMTKYVGKVIGTGRMTVAKKEIDAQREIVVVKKTHVVSVDEDVALIKI
ncbi:hypothetical protein ACFX16_007676 [Malus domestica]